MLLVTSFLAVETEGRALLWTGLGCVSSSSITAVESKQRRRIDDDLEGGVLVLFKPISGFGLRGGIGKVVLQHLHGLSYRVYMRVWIWTVKGCFKVGPN